MKNFLKRKARIYIWPTRMGGYLIGLIFLMFLLSIGYSNNLLLIFTLFLFGMNFIWLIQTHFHLYRLKFDGIQIEDGHADTPLKARLHWGSVPSSPWGWEISLENDSSLPLTNLQHGLDSSNGSLVIPERGVYQWAHLKIKTIMPFGLYKTWIYFPIQLKLFVYPAKVREMIPLNLISSHAEGDFESSRKGSHDVSNLAPYQGEDSRKISWKHYARLGELVVKEGEESASVKVHFRIDVLDPRSKEYQLSQMATQMVSCSLQDIPFELVTPERTLHGKGAGHLQDSLRELAEC